MSCPKTRGSKTKFVVIDKRMEDFAHGVGAIFQVESCQSRGELMVEKKSKSFAKFFCYFLCITRVNSTLDFEQILGVALLFSMIFKRCFLLCRCSVLEAVPNALSISTTGLVSRWTSIFTITSLVWQQWWGLRTKSNSYYSTVWMREMAIRTRTESFFCTF